MAAVPVPVVIVLATLSFFLGRFQQQSYQLPEVQSIPGGALPAQGAKVQQVGQLPVLPGRDGGASPAAPVQRLSPAEFEKFVLDYTDLNLLRPPVPPAPSGNSFYSVVPFQYLSWYPRTVLYPGFMDDERCDHIIRLAKTRLTNSDIAYKPGEKPDEQQQTRTSKGTFIGREQDPDGVLAWLEEKIAAVTFLPVNHGEYFNVLQYQHLQHYDSHMDTFDPKDFGPQESQRTATMLLYLSDVTQGGETVFKHEGKGGEAKTIEDWTNCDDGSFKYQPRKGDAVLFWSLTPNLEVDPHALHGGCPVISGEKWVATKWIHDKPV